MVQSLSDDVSYLGDLLPNVFLGSFPSCRLLEERQITHVLSLGLQLTPFTRLKWKGIEVEDSAFADMLGFLDEAVAFIHLALQEPNARVLVHCVAGVSRSPTVVLAYLVRHCGLSVEEALGRLREIRVCVCPNDGFMQQLQLFQRRLLKSRHPQVANRDYIRCRTCRYLLCPATSLLPGHGDGRCSTFQIHPPDWLAVQMSKSTEGKIACANCRCGAKLGTWNAHGHKCPCGTWCPRWVGITASKVDLIHP
ncbi:protein-tyrosine phosphatase-like protein [Gaertneriomyces semiglobifer]|nr:protein-tyrosine phosphatase-like protein [Gaertneriomyces semiglobifer]